MTHEGIDYAAIIRDKGYRVTPQREAILDAICAAGGHTTIGEIYARVRSIDPTIDRSTLYRALELFVALGVVVSANVGRGETVYEIAQHRPHHHLVCEACGMEKDIDHETIKLLFDVLEHKQGFTIDMDHLVLFGRCSQCSQQPPTET